MKFCIIPPQCAEKDVHGSILFAEAVFRPPEKQFAPSNFVLLTHYYAQFPFAPQNDVINIPSLDGTVEKFNFQSWLGLEDESFILKMRIISKILPMQDAHLLNWYIDRKLNESDEKFAHGDPALTIEQIAEKISTIVSDETPFSDFLNFFESIAVDREFKEADRIFDDLNLLGMRYK